MTLFEDIMKQQRRSCDTMGDSARAWRKERGLNRKQLSHLIGFSMSAIQDYENGFNRTRGPISESQWLRYRLACTAIQSGAPLAF
jgi:transcriptional regulator with XRE-family HTH domain